MFCEYYDNGYCAHMGESCLEDGGKNVKGCARYARHGNLCPDCLSDGKFSGLFIREDDFIKCGTCRMEWPGMSALVTSYTGYMVQLREERDEIKSQHLCPPLTVANAEARQ